MKERESNKAESSSQTNTLAHIMVISVVLVGLLVFAYYIYVQYNNAFQVFESVPELSAKALTDKELTKADVAGLLGTRGDYFGGLLNPILAFVSFLALLYTIILQTRELSMTREELKKTAEANKEQAEALVEQVKASRQQQFDSTFSTLLSEHNKILNEIFEQSPAGKILDVTDRCSIFIFRKKVLANDSYCKYYRFLYQLLKFIARNHPSNNQQNFNRAYLMLQPSAEEKAYASIVRAMIPHDVLKGLAANCAVLSRVDSDYYEYIQLIERYAMLEHLNMSPSVSDSNLFERLTLEGGAICVYRHEAFGNNESLRNALVKLRDGLVQSESPLTLLSFVNGGCCYYASSVMSNLLCSRDFVDYEKRCKSKRKSGS